MWYFIVDDDHINTALLPQVLFTDSDFAITLWYEDCDYVKRYVYSITGKDLDARKIKWCTGDIDSMNHVLATPVNIWRSTSALMLYQSALLTQ